jgi:hypothetical protein
LPTDVLLTVVPHLDMKWQGEVAVEVV